MWALVENDSVSKVYQNPKAITIGDVNYPSNIFSLWSSEDLEAIGIYEVVVDNSNYKDPEYYINTNQSFVYANGVVTASYGTATAKHLDDWTSEDLDGNSVTNKGLKSTHKDVINSQAYGLLQPNDWYVVRNADDGTAIPAEWSTYRADVRTTAEDMKSKIEAVTTVDELAALYVYSGEPPVRPLGEWPTPPSN
jgi:hypothetical protein